MKVICTFCGAKASSKCPQTRSIFPVDQQESFFWLGLGYTSEPAGSDWKEGTKKLVVKMVMNSDETEQDALKRLVNKLKQIPEDKMTQWTCKHYYQHTEVCSFCSMGSG